jgi:succinoglycan biosynthesis transport protein ExoP
MQQKVTSGAQSIAGDAPSSRRMVRPLHSIIRHRWVALSLAAAVAVAAIPVLAKLRRPVYRAESVFMVSPATKSPGEDRESLLPRYAEFVNQQLLLVNREDVCLEALDRLGNARSAWQGPDESMQEAAARLSASLQVSRVPSTTYVAVGLNSARRDGLVDILNAVMKAYMDRAKVQTHYGLDARSEAVGRRVTELQDEIRAKSDQLARWAKDLDIPSMEPGMLARLIEETQRIPGEAQERRIAAEARLAGVEARYKVLKEATAADRTVLVPDAELLQIRTVLLGRRNELKAKLFGLTGEHEGRKAVESEIADIDSELAREEKSALDRQIRLAASKLEESRANELVVAQAEVADAKRYEQVVGEQKGALREKILRVYSDSQVIQQEVERQRRQLGIAQERLDAMRLETQAPGYVQLVTSAALSEVPSDRRLLKGVGAMAGLALFLVFVVPIVMDLMRDRVRSDSDVEGAALAIPQWKGDRSSDPVVGDQLRRLALALDRERRIHNRSAFVFTSVLPGAGTTQLVLDIARELGEFGVSALAIEANALKPDARFSPNGHPGLCAGMSKGIRASEMVVLGDEALPDRIAVGATEGRTTLSGLEKIDSFLGQVLGRYQAVLIDAPPILKSADAEYLASRGQAVVLVVEAERTPIADLDRANRILRQAGANVVLTVMNRARRWKDQGQSSAVALAEQP